MASSHPFQAPAVVNEKESAEGNQVERGRDGKRV